MTELEIQSRVEALREDALTIARELSHRSARPGMGYRETLAAEQMQGVANSLGNVERSVVTLASGRTTEAA
jgi:hypothetical protein